MKKIILCIVFLFSFSICHANSIASSIQEYNAFRIVINAPTNLLQSQMPIFSLTLKDKDKLANGVMIICDGYTGKVLQYQNCYGKKYFIPPYKRRNYVIMLAANRTITWTVTNLTPERYSCQLYKMNHHI